MRGAEIVPGQHSFRIGSDGFEVFPRLETTLPQRVPTQEDARGLRHRRGSTRRSAAASRAATRRSLIGPSGVGKTLLALRFIDAGLEQGERCLHISFQETEEQVREKAAAAGWDWSRYGDEQLVIRHIPPVELDLDQVGALVRTRARARRRASASSSTASPSSRSPRARPSACPATSGRSAASSAPPAARRSSRTRWRRSASGDDLGGLSFIFNNVFFLRYVEIESELRRGLNVLKMRQSEHEKGLLEFGIDANGARRSASRSKGSPACSAGARSAASSDQPPTSSIRSSAIAPLRSV